MPAEPARDRSSTRRAGPASDHDATDATPSTEHSAAVNHLDCRKTHVVKRMAPDQAGALKLAERFGDRLVCVRYRHDAARQHRHTTVELVVASAPIRHRGSSPLSKRPMQVVAIQLQRDELELRQLVLEQGGVCAPDSGLWYILRSAAKALDLLHRVV